MQSLNTGQITKRCDRSSNHYLSQTCTAVGAFFALATSVIAQNPRAVSSGDVRYELAGGVNQQHVCQATSSAFGVEVARTCSLSGGGVASFSSQVLPAGVLRAFAALDLGSSSALTLAGHQSIFATSATFYSDRITMRGINGFAPPASVQLNWSFGGVLLGSAGTWEGNSNPLLHGQFNMIYDPGGPLGTSWGGTYDVAGASSSHTRFRGASTITQNANFNNQSGVVEFVDLPVTASSAFESYLDFTVSLQAAVWLENLSGNGFTDVGHAVYDTANFSHTAQLAGVSAFDAQGRDVSSNYEFRLSNGTMIAAGTPTLAPEPSSLALSAVGLLLTLLAATGRSNRKRTQHEVQSKSRS